MSLLRRELGIRGWAWGGLLLAALAGDAHAEELPIIDSHSHHARGLNLVNVIARMDAARIEKIVLFARRQGTDEEILSLHAKYPDRVVAAVGFQNPGWLRQRPDFLDEVEAKLRSGRFRWMGELLLKHYGVPELRAPDFDISPDTHLFRKVLDLSAQYGVPATVHHEAEPGNLEIFRRALRHNPAALVVWAHWCGRTTPEIARTFLQEFSILSCDLGASQIPKFNSEKNPLLDPAGALPEKWRTVIEAFPDRFLAAIDAVEPRHYDHYVAWVRRQRKALAGLPPEIARRVAVGNAEGLLNRWKGSSPARNRPSAAADRSP